MHQGSTHSIHILYIWRERERERERESTIGAIKLFRCWVVLLRACGYDNVFSPLYMQTVSKSTGERGGNVQNRHIQHIKIVS